MIGIVGLMFALCAFTATVVGVNVWYTPVGTPYNYDILAAAQHITLKVSQLINAPNEVNWALGSLALILPAILVYQMIRGAFGSGT